MAVTVGIAGITGKFARLLVSSLLKTSDIHIRGFCRDPSELPPNLTSSSAVTLLKGYAFDATAVKTFVKGCDVVVCCYLGDDHLMTEGQKLLIDASEDAGVARYVASDWALDYTKLKLGELFPNDPMIHIKAYLDQKEKIKGVHILVGGFMDPFYSAAFVIWDPSTTTFRYWGTGNEIWEGTSYQNAAEYTAAVCADSGAIGIQRLVGGRSSFNEIVQAFEKVYGIKPNVERNGSLEDMYERMHRIRSQHPQNIYGYMFLFFQYYMVNGQTLIGPPYDDKKYPNVKPVDSGAFMRATPEDYLASAYFSLL